MTWIFFFFVGRVGWGPKKNWCLGALRAKKKKRGWKKNKRNFANPLVRVLRYLGGFSTWRGLPPPSWSRMKEGKKKKKHHSVGG